MRIGVSSYSFSSYIASHPNTTYTEICTIAKEIGFDGIEFVNLDAFGGVLGEASTAHAARIRTHCKEIGLDIFAYTVGADLLAQNREEQVEATKRSIDIAHALGAKVLRHDLTWNLPQGMSWQDAIPVMFPSVREITEYAQQAGIRTCSENHGFIFQNPERVKAVIDCVAHPNYGWLVDIGNFMCTDCDSLASVRIAAPYAFHVHAKDFKKIDAGGITTPAGNHIAGTILGHGVVDIQACMDELKKAGYEGTVSLEFEGPEDPIEAIKEGYQVLSRCAK